MLGINIDLGSDSAVADQRARSTTSNFSSGTRRCKALSHTHTRIDEQLFRVRLVRPARQLSQRFAARVAVLP